MQQNYTTTSVYFVHDDLRGVWVIPSALPAPLGYAYCSLAYLPAFPWEDVATPPGVPSPRALFVGGIDLLEISGSVAFRRAGIWGACAVVPTLWVLLALTRKNVGRYLLVATVFGEGLFMLVIKKLTAALACTSVGTIAHGQNDTICQLGNSSSALSCMDTLPEVPCWGDEHMRYASAVVLLLLPYYMTVLALKLQAKVRSAHPSPRAPYSTAQCGDS